MTMIPISGFAPDVDPTGQGVTVDVINLIPTNRGMRAALSGEAITPSLPEAAISAFSQLLLDSSGRVFCCSASKIYELIAGVWVNRSKAGGYTTPDGGVWRMTQFGDITIATNGTDPVQQSQTSGPFLDLPNAPKADICESVAGFVMLFGTDDGIDQFPDGWWCSGLYDHTAWDTTANAFVTQAANGRLLDTPGRITAGRRLGSGVAVYKRESMYFGQYVGPPTIWNWTLVTTDSGAYSHESVIYTDSVHYFLGPNGLFQYDGSRPAPLGSQEIKTWLDSNLNKEFSGNIRSGIDKKHSLLYWFFPSIASSGACDLGLVYHQTSGKFGKLARGLSSTIDATLPNKTWGELAAMYPTYDALTTETWASPLFYGADIGFCFLGLDGRLYKGDGGPALPSTIETGDIGDDSTHVILTRVRPRFLKAPEAAELTVYHKRNAGEALTEGPTVAMVDSKMDVRVSDRFHRLKITFQGAHEITALDTTIKANGAR